MISRRFDELSHHHFLFASRIRFHLFLSNRVCAESPVAIAGLCHIFPWNLSGYSYFYWFGASVCAIQHMHKLNRRIAGEFMHLLLVYLVCSDLNMQYLWSLRSIVLCVCCMRPCIGSTHERCCCCAEAELSIRLMG